MRLPQALGYLFYRYRTDNIDTKKHFNLIVMTVLNDGSLDDWRWLFACYGWQQIRDWVADSQNSRSLSPEMETFWTGMLLATPRKRDRWAGGNGVRTTNPQVATWLEVDNVLAARANSNAESIISMPTSNTKVDDLGRPHAASNEVN
ncbi:hypothetical protein [Ferrimicrobium sp.]|uniref:DUF6922 domain-containing protein n=1 Tax=Ferrimicrobium sp. TaxID=2926050 RepID=UPI002627E871|nr:hypothetical protein [Ferrimicrobium sp.]